MATRIRLEEIKDDDTILLVVGANGAGKSTFINTVVGQDLLEVNDSLESRPTEITAVRGGKEGTHVFLDTPGFDNGFETNEMVSARSPVFTAISNTIQKIGKKIAGIVYCQQLTANDREPRMMANFAHLTEMCGDTTFSNFLFVTIVHDDLPATFNVEGTEQKWRDLWAAQIESGAKTTRFNNTPKGVPAIWQTIASLPPPVVIPRLSMFRPDDVIIAIFGAADSGKSRFISSLTGRSGVVVQKFKPFTTEVQTARSPSKERSAVVFVDTPDFDHRHRSDTEILRMLADWLTKTYRSGVQLAGLIYLQSIADTQPDDTLLKNVTLFSKLCGNIALKNVALVTTMWDSVDLAAGEARQQELVETVWRPMLDQGCSAAKFHPATGEYGWELVDSLIVKTRVDMVLLQDELINMNRRLNETEAGKALHRTLQLLFNTQKKTVQELRLEVARQQDDVRARQLQLEYEAINGKLQSTFEQIHEMRIPFLRRVALLFSFRKSRARTD